VTAVPPGAGTPTGTVTFSVNGKQVGTAPLSGGTATLTHTVPRGGTRNVAAVYGGDTDFTGSSGSTSAQHPSITATVSSKFPRTKFGWYRSPVTVTFVCTTQSPLTMPCPGPVTLSHNGAGQSVTETITAANGGAASVTIKHINIDTVPPTVSVFGPKNGATYFGAAPAAHCAGHDALSGLASCTLSQSRSGDKVTVTATATDRAGNVATASITFDVLHFYVLNAPYNSGAFQLREGHSYTFVALTAASTNPRLYAAVPDGQVPSQPGTWSRRAGHEPGLSRYTLAVPVGRGYTGHAYWDFGVKVGSTMNLVRFHPVG
jgi:hypothetical protein